MTIKWEPHPASDQTLEDVSLSEWIGQAIGTASGCWVGGTGDAVFDSTRASLVADSLHTHVQSVIQGVIEGESKHSVSNATTRELLVELRTRAENWAGMPGSGSLATCVDDTYQAIRNLLILDGRREP